MLEPTHVGKHARFIHVVACVAIAVWQTLLSAQWLHYPTANVPKLPNGRPNLTAPPPRGADGRPDLSGIWTAADVIPDPGCGADEVGCIPEGNLPLRAVNIALSSVADFTRLTRREIAGRQLLPYQTWAADLVTKRGRYAGAGIGDPKADDIIDQHARCMPPNFPRAWALPQYKRIVQTPGFMVVLDEFNASYRQIFTDDRPLPVDPVPTWNGYSSARWDGDTLVVQSIGFRDDLWLDMSGSPLTEAARVTERLRRVNYGRLQVQVTVADPKAYSRPWTVPMDQSIVLDTELLDHICLENEKDVAHFVAQ
jgi:hypothetical protein